MTLKIIYIGPMELPIPSEKGAVEEIIWQLSQRLKKVANVFVFNPLSTTTINKVVKSLKLLVSGFSDNYIIHSHNLYTSIALSSNFMRFKHILTLHYPPNITKSKERRKILEKTLKYLDRAGTIITAPSRYIKERLKDTGIKQVVYLPNGVDLSLFNPLKRSDELREKLLEGKDVLIVNVGRKHPHKNQLALLIALNKIVHRHDYRNLKLVLIGPTSGTFKGGKENPYYRLLIEYIQKHSLKPYVTFAKLPRRQQVAKFLASSDIYVHPSRVEAAPLAILEAMASKLPIVAFDLPYYRGCLVHEVNALLATPFNVNKLTTYLLTLIEDSSLRRKLAENACKDVNKRFSWDSLSPLYLHLYKRVLGL